MSKNEKITAPQSRETPVAVFGRWLTEDASATPRAPAATPGTPEDRQRCWMLAAALTRIRDIRNRTLGDDIPFSDPAWDIMLDLYTARLSGDRLSVTDVAIGSGIPLTTALRWVDLLRRKGAIERTRDPTDRRRTFLALSETQFELLNGLFRSISELMSDADARSNRSSIKPKGI